MTLAAFGFSNLDFSAAITGKGANGSGGAGKQKMFRSSGENCGRSEFIRNLDRIGSFGAASRKNMHGKGLPADGPEGVPAAVLDSLLKKLESEKAENLGQEDLQAIIRLLESLTGTLSAKLLADMKAENADQNSDLPGQPLNSEKAAALGGDDLFLEKAVHAVLNLLVPGGSVGGSVGGPGSDSGAGAESAKGGRAREIVSLLAQWLNMGSTSLSRGDAALEETGMDGELRRVAATLARLAQNAENPHARPGHAGGRANVIGPGKDFQKSSAVGSADREDTGLLQKLDDFIRDKTAAGKEPRFDDPARKTGNEARDAKASGKPGKTDEYFRAFLNSLARQLAEGGGQPDLRAGMKPSGFQVHRAPGMQHLSMQNGSGMQPGATSGTGDGIQLPGPEPGVSTGEFTSNGGMASNTGEKAFFSAPEPSGPAGSFEKHLQPMEKQVVSQVFVRLFSGARQGSGSMTVNIHPPELGSVRVRILSDQGRLSVQLQPQNAQVAGMLERNLPMLQQSLADQGVDIDDLRVSVDPGSQEKSGFGEHAFGETPGRTGPSADADGDDPGALSGEDRMWTGDAHSLSLRV